MPDGPFVFVDIDTQRDFMEPGGALYVPDAVSIIPNLARLTTHARARRIPILASACAHTLDQPDPEPFPPHCLVGTMGQARIEATTWPGTLIVPPDGHAPEAIVPHLTLEKQRYDLFTNPAADAIIRVYATERPTFVVYGVATDYCVSAAVLGLCQRHQKVAVVVDAIRAVEPARESAALERFVKAGALLTLTEVVCKDG